ncbi:MULTISPECIES: hypothetical protein [unclassified Bradyrhizobium]|uniref:hypothetical protein n=1 Tax=unclassified Bradyrhizobium TaxID=2631580 RepID=UPI001BA87D7F|nr:MULTISPECIES: hypothetical protein [unclassified Bradyrhizobium]WLA52377.1 hypothetical protein QIH80_21155 [Bradyrhizobium elkanii]MBR1206958.1 hypothetical protein [Bradyrhizobium sp. AUGA SZCCT0124]MBR1313497.1 hypothetical protein [Bradyrhizobium sp. AUGA SZCCT0051]MBR1343406.1 hypothetical protein [Bradyrhizobium sp. AUGA SZCCT0105]MBR1357174.1 hypothetical protein [Bradyrhizobium sp. AUGA SZCCT0045]
MTESTAILDLSAHLPVDTFRLQIRRPGTDTPLGWVIELAGPAHAQTIALNNESTRDAIEKEKAIEFAQVNGRKWKTEDETVADRRRQNVTKVCRRIVGWSPNPTFKTVSPDPIPFTIENAVDLFLRPELGSFFVQVTDYLTSERAFTRPSSQT